MEENNWGWLAPFEKFGRLGDSKDNFQPIEYSEAKSKHPSFTHASHGMIFARDDRVLWDLYKARGAVLVRFIFGFKRSTGRTLWHCYRYLIT